MSANAPTAFQDRYAEDVAHCYGCGRLNPHGHQLKSYWGGEDTVASFVPAPHHTAIQGCVYGGLIASLIDCHGTGSAAAAAARAAGAGDDAAVPLPRFVTASLHVDYLKPTPLGPALELRGTIAQQTERKAVVDITITVGTGVTARGRVVAVRMPEGTGVPH
jgi:acyl-coenzyme A thioesterase PaaI-like protein